MSSGPLGGRRTFFGQFRDGRPSKKPPPSAEATPSGSAIQIHSNLEPLKAAPSSVSAPLGPGDGSGKNNNCAIKCLSSSFHFVASFRAPDFALKLPSAWGCRKRLLTWLERPPSSQEAEEEEDPAEDLAGSFVCPKWPSPLLLITPTRPPSPRQSALGPAGHATEVWPAVCLSSKLVVCQPMGSAPPSRLAGWTAGWIARLQLQWLLLT